MCRRVYKYMRVNVLEIDTARGYSTQEHSEELNWDCSSRSGFFPSLSYANLPGQTLSARVNGLDIRLPSQRTRRWMDDCSQMAQKFAKGAWYGGKNRPHN